MPDNNKQYSVYIEGMSEPQIIDEKTFNKNRDDFYKQFPDAEVKETSKYDPNAEINENDAYAIYTEGMSKPQYVDASTFAGRRDEFFKSFPSAEVWRVHDVTAQRNRDFARQYEYAQSKVDDANLPDEEKQQYIDFVGQNADRYGKVRDKYGNQYKPDGSDRLIDIYSRMEALQSELDSLPEEKDYRGLSREAAIQYAQEANSPEGRRRSEIKKELEQLRKERENNPAWIAYWNKTKDELPGLIDAMDAKAKENANVSGRSANMSDQEALDLIGGAEERQGNEQEQDYYLTARKYYKEALDTAKAPSKYDDSWGIVNFAKGAGANIASAASIVELAKALQDVNLLNTVKQIQQAEGKDVNLIDLVNNQSDKLNYLSDGQKEMLKAFAKRYEVEQGRSDNMSIGYNAGKGAVQSLGFMGDFLMTGGAGSAVAKGLLKTTAKEMPGKTLTEAGKKLLVGNLEGATKALVMTPLMPSSYANFIDTMTQLNGDGQMDLSAKAVRKAIEDGLIETFSENAGDLFGIPFGTKYFDGITKSNLGKVGRAMSRTGAGEFFKNAGWHGLIGEMAEEVLGNAMRSIPEVGTDPEALKNFFSGDEFWTTLASFAPMSVISGGASAYQIRKAGKQMSKYGDQLKTMLTNLGLNEEQEEEVEFMLDMSENKTPEEIGSAIAKIGKFAGETGLLTQDIAPDLGMAMGQYLRSTAEYRTLQGIFDEEQDAARAQNVALIDEQVGNNLWYHQGEEGNYVRTITDAEGNERFVVSTLDGQKALVGRDGSKSFLTNEELEAGIADGSLIDSGEQPINDYLDGITEQEQKAAEEQRMTEETATQLTAIQERIAADPTINMGTEEAPKMGVVDAVNANGVHVTWQDEDGAKDATLTWEQVGNYLGTPVEVKTDEQIEQEEIQAEEDIRSRKEEYNKTIPEGTEFTAVLVEGEEPVTYQFKRAFLNEDGTMMLQVVDKATGKDEQITEDMALQGNLTSVLDSLKTPEEIQAEEVQTEEEAPQEEDNTLRDFRGNPIPLKDDGSVNQTALWNADPEAWARWNDSQRNDGGVNSRGYIAKATKKLQSDAKAVQKQINKELDFDKIENLEGQLASINSRIADLERIENNYANAEVTQAEAVQTPEEVPAPEAETTEAAPITAATPEVQEEAVPQTPEQMLESRLAEAKTPEEKRQALEEYYALTTTDPTVVGTRADILQRMTELGFSERVIGQVRDQLNAEGTLTEGFHIGNTIFIVADDIRDARRAKLAHLHERWHEINRQEGYQNVVASMPGATTEYLLDTANKLAGVSDKNGYGDYLNYPNPQQALADEVIALSMEVVAESTPENVDENLRNAGLDNQEIINFVKTIYNGERGNDQETDSAGRDTLSGDNAQEGERQDGGDIESQPEGILGEQGSGSGEGSPEGTEGAGEQVTPTLTPAQQGAIDYVNGDGSVFRIARLDNKGIAANGEEVRFSVRYSPQESEIDRIAQDIADQIGVDKSEAERWVRSETSLAAIITGQSAFLDYEGDDRYTAIKKDSDYPQGTVDFNNICRKRLAFTEMYQRVQKAFPNTVITGEDLATIRNIMKSHDLMVACGLCYVEDRRQMLGEIASGFINDLHDGFKGYAKRKGYLDKPGDKGSVKAREKVVKDLKDLLGDDSKEDLSIYDLITLEGSTRLFEQHPGLYNAFRRYNSARGQNSGNLFQGYAEYKREILKWNKKKVKDVNDNGGLRVFSYSDFEAHHLIDLVQIIQDCARKGVKIQGYTKVPAFARAVANTGIKLNRSLIPLGDTGIVDGKLAYDSVEGIDINDPNFLPSNDNIGNILIGINDEQIRLAMADPFIHFIIPYHSNQRQVLRNMKQTGAWTNYVSSQVEKDANGFKAEQVNIYTDVLNAAEAEGNPITNERQFTEKFLEVCKERGLTPRFAQFLDQNENGDYVYTPGYYKFLVDFKLFDEQGRILPQEPVRAEFDDGFNAEILNDYVKEERAKLGENLDDVYNEIVDKLGLEKRDPDIRFRKINDTQKQPASDAAQPVVTEEDVMDVAMFRLSKNNKATVESWLKKREDINDEQRAEVVDYIDKLDDAKTQLATAKWFANGTIRIPEDMKKVQQAISVAGKAKVDPLRYNSPMELLDAHADFKPSEERINPDEVSTLHRAAEYPDDGIVVYDVDNTKESRENMRKIINTHFGEDASPWCLLQGDGKGNLTADSAKYWRHYNAYPKQVAFKDGKLLAFSANDRSTRLWWDRKDESHYGIPITQKIEGDELGRSANFIIEDGQLVKEPGSHLFRGNKQNGVYEEWSTDGSTLLERTNYKNGEEDGLTESWYPNGQMQRRTTMKNGNYVGRYEAWYDNGNKNADMTFTEEGFNDGGRKTWWKNGNPRTDSSYKNGKRVGEFKFWDEDGDLESVQYYDENGEKLGFEEHEHWGLERKVTFTEGDGQIDERFFRGGRPASVTRTKNGKLEGLQEFFYTDGTPQTRGEYSNGERNGIFERYHPNGKLMARGEYRNGMREGIHEMYNKDGVLTARLQYHYDERIRDLTPDENVQFRLSNMQEMDQEFEAAYNNNDEVTAQRMVDEMAEAAGYTIRGYHGTTHDFTIFDRSKGNAEGNWGKGFYFTNNEDDADVNYAGEGPDLTNRIELLAENMEWMDGYEDMDYEQRLEEARKQLAGDNPHVISAAIKMENPVVFDSRGGQDETYFDYNENYNEETEEYEGEPTGKLVDFVEAWDDVLSDWEWEGNNVSPAEILEYANYEGLTATQLEDKAREILAYVENSEGQVATGEFLRQVFERMGFDGIVDNNVNQKFGSQRRYGRGMDGVDYGTTHVIAFQPNQIKQADPFTFDDEGKLIPLSKRFDSWNDDIRFRKAFDSVKGELGSEKVSVDNPDLMNEYGLSNVTMTKKGDVVTLNKVVVTDQKKGNGTRFIQDFTREADKEGWTLALTPDDSFGATSVSRLKKFYKRFGFKENKGKNADLTINESMIRKPEEDVRFRKVEPIVDEKSEELFEQAKKTFGTTNNLAEAGYVIPDGSMLDFSGRHLLDPGQDSSWMNGMRQVDHREITDINYEKDGNTPSGYETDMRDFIRRGAIRLNSGVINLATKPTKGQENVLWGLIRRANGDVDVDFGDGYDTDHYASYNHARPERILNDIRRYFDEGIEPEGNVMFRKANQTQNGFISNAQMALDKIKMDKATPEQWIKMLEKEGGLKAGEDKWLGLSDWLKASDKKTLTKEEIADFIEQNRIQIDEVRYTEDDDQVATELNERYPGFNHAFFIEEDAFRGNAYIDGLNDIQAAIDLYNREHEDKIEWGDYLTDEKERKLIEFGQELLDKGNKESRPINQTRLTYTTPGLDNKREIALTVPTIDPWNEGDKIHFGDAGEGRVIAWIRFGDTEISRKHEELDRRTKAVRDYIAYLEKKYSPFGYMEGGAMEREKMTAEEKERLNALRMEESEQRAKEKFFDKILVIDEIQSKRHQEGREKGYKKDLTDAEKEEIENAGKEYKALTDPMKEKYGAGIVNPGNFMGWPEVTEEDRETMKRAEAIRQRVEDLRTNQREGIPAAPFEKNWHELAMKRMLRLAAEEGYDKIAWTTGDQQAERYNLGTVAREIKAEESYRDDAFKDIYVNGEHIASVNQNGDALGGEYAGKNLSEIVGKEIAVKLMEEGEVSLSGNDLRIGGEGMRGFYDDILPRFMNKYGKKWGVKVQDIELPEVYDEVGHPLVMHSVDVTPEMKESVMEGQVMFRKGQITPEQDKEYMEAVQAGNMEKAQQMVREAAALAMPNTKVVDEDGKPAVVYHGSTWNPLEEKVGEGVFKDSFRGTGSGDNGFFGRGFYFTYGNGELSRAEAGYYGRTITEAFLNIENPFLFNETLYEYNGAARNVGDEKNSVEAINMVKNFPELCKHIFLTTFNGEGEEDGEIALEDYAALFEEVYRNKAFIVNETDNSDIIEVLADPVSHRYTNPLGKEIEWTDYAFRLQMYRPGKNEDAQLAFTHFYLTDMTDLRREDAREMVISLPSNLFSEIFESEEFTDTLKARGYDGVLQSAKGDEAVAFNANQIKSAEPVTYDDNGEVIPLSERFNEESDDIRFSLRGIIGAENAEDEVALDNLEVAEEMENAGKDSPTIWRATGWERGADGKWRNEIPDAKQKEGVSLQKRNIAGEVLDAPELFDSYPELAEMPIDLVNSAAAGAYNREQKRITLDTDYNTTFEMSKEDKKKVEESTIDFIRNGSWKRQSDIVKFKNGLSEQYGKLVLNSNGITTILHELQHAIQQIEGFAKGTNDKLQTRLYYQQSMKTKPEETYFAWFLSRKNSTKKLNQVGRDRVIRYAENYDQTNLAEQDKGYFNNLVDHLKRISDDEYKKLVTRAAKIVKAAEKAGEANYEKSAGEVEARNVERRSTLSDEKRQKYSPEATEEYSRSEQIVQFRKVSDPATLERLESEPTIKVYRAMQEIDGQLYPPMAAKVEGKMQEPIELGVWEEAVERPDLVDAKGYFTLNKGNGKSIKARYNPYIHTSRSPLNDQFTSAYDRPNLVTVEVEVPESELTSGYKAEKAKDSVGEMTWHAGPVSSKLPEEKSRKVILSRWDKPIRIVPDSEVADRIAELLEGEDIAVPYNTVTPSLREELEKRGVQISDTPSGKVKETETKEDVLFRRSQDLFNESREGGLTRVIGDENATELYHNVYRAIPKEIRERIVNKAGDGFLFSEATRDAIAEAVENGDPTGLAGLASNMLRDYVGPLDERTARYILWRGDRKAEDDDLLDTVKDITMQRRLQVGQFADPVMFRLSDNLEESQNRAESMADDAQQTKDEKKEFAKVNDALTTIKAMSLQKEYDRKTVNTITVLAKNVLKNQSIETLSRHEIARLLGIITTSIGKAPKTVKKNADALVGLIVDHLLRSEETKLGMLANTKASKTNQAGVEVQGTLDVRGQNVLKAYKAGLDMDLENPEDEFDGNTIKGRLNTLSDRLSSEDDAVRSEAEDEYAGLMLAQEYQEKIKASVNEERGLKNEMKEAAEAYRDGDISRTSYNQFVEEAEKSVRENKIERIEAYRDLRLKMLQMMEGSIDARKEFTEREKQRVEEIHHLANSDMQGEDASPFKEPTRMGRFANSSIVRFFSKPLITFDQMLRLFGQKNVAGEGYLFNKFHRGWIDATEKAYLGDKQAKEELDAKVSEVFDKKMRWSDLYAEERKMPTVKVKWWDGGQMKEHELTQGNLLYIYMVNKMTDGRMKLRRMGITDEHVDAIKKQMDERFIELADWLQGEYLVNKRNKYNAVHERLFGASMAAIEDYFPLKINQRSLNKAEDISRPEFDDVLPATTTGSIIKRTRNAQDLDLLGADAFSVVIEHIEKMEKWAAFAEFNKDLNTLLSYKRFRNQVQNMDTVYGSGNELWKNFKSVCKIAGGTYTPAGKKSDLDTAALNIAKGVTSAKISFRIYTALKQFLSMPAFVSDANPKYLAQNLATPWKAWNWAMENLPMYEKRWKSRMVGDTRLMNTESDWKFFRSKVYDTLSRLGMSPNAFVDAMTIAIGSHSMYQTRYDRYIQDGYTEEQADKKAKQDATTLYNETQQSNEAAFVSPVQLDRTVLATMLTVFRNSSMGYQRQLHDAIRNIGKMMKPGYKAASIEFMTKQMVRDGLTEEQAEHAANRSYNREIWRSAARIGTFGFLVQFAWNLGGSIAYLLFGDDDDKKEEMLTEALIHGLIGGSMEGLAGGNVISEALNMVAKGESLNNYDPSLLPIISDMKSAYKKMSYDPVAGANDLVNLAVQAGLGVNPQTLTDAVVAVVDACGGDLETSTEAMLLIMRVLQVPQSQVDQIYIDELGVNADKARTMSAGEMAERYAKYKVAKGAPLTGWAYSDEAEEKREKAYLKRFKKLVKERKESK